MDIGDVTRLTDVRQHRSARLGQEIKLQQSMAVGVLDVDGNGVKTTLLQTLAE